MTVLAALNADGALATLAYAVLGAVLLVLGTVVVDLATPGPLLERLREGSANAAALMIGNMVAVAAIVVAAGMTSPTDLAEGLASTAGYGAMGIVVQAVLLVGIGRLLKIDYDAILRQQTLAPAAVVVAAASVALGAVLVVAVV